MYVLAAEADRIPMEIVGPAVLVLALLVAAAWVIALYR